MNKPAILMAALVALIALAPTGTAQLVGAGLSGQCYDTEAENGGQDEARVDSDGNVVVLPSTVADPTGGIPSGTGGAAPALLLFATESVKEGGQTGFACKRYDCFTQSQCTGRPLRYDYLEVDANAGDVFVQACYNGQATVSGTCPKSPTGPGA